MKFGSLCALGGFAPYPVMSARTHFPEDFGAKGIITVPPKNPGTESGAKSAVDQIPPVFALTNCALLGQLNDIEEVKKAAVINVRL